MIPSLTTKTETQIREDKICERDYHTTLVHQEECGKRLQEHHAEWLRNFHLRFGADVTR